LPIFRCNIQGRKKTDQKDAKGNIIYTEWEDAGVFFVGSIQKNSGWRQIVFPINSANSYDETRVSLYNFATDNMANDFMIDDICLFVSQLPFAAYQGKMACRTTADSKTHAVAVLRLDYSKIDKDNDGFMYYQVYNENLKSAVNLSGDAAYYHEAHEGGAHTGDTYYGSVKIPEANYTPQSGDKTYQSVTKFVDDLMTSGEKNGIAYAEKIKAENPNPSGLDMRYKFQNDTQLVFFPNLDISQVTSLLGVCMGAVNLIAIPPLDIDNVTTIEQSFRDTNIKQLTLRNAQKCTKWTNILYLCSSIEILHISGWKQGNIAILQSNLLSPESIDNAIENAIDVIDGAEEGRTLQLHATAGANWDANSKYQGEERKLLLTQKGIEVTW
jgi:hypothetical protein